MYRGAWRATVHRIPKRCIQLNDQARMHSPENFITHKSLYTCCQNIAKFYHTPPNSSCYSFTDTPLSPPFSSKNLSTLHSCRVAFLRMSHKLNHTACNLLSLVSLTQHNFLEIHPRCFVYQ